DRVIRRFDYETAGNRNRTFRLLLGVGADSADVVCRGTEPAPRLAATPFAIRQNLRLSSQYLHCLQTTSSNQTEPRNTAAPSTRPFRSRRGQNPPGRDSKTNRQTAAASQRGHPDKPSPSDHRDGNS